MNQSVAVECARIAHTMLRVADLDASIAFYTEKLWMKLLRKENYPDAQFTLAFVGYDDERSSAVIELTHNWNRTRYEKGTAYGHIAVEVNDLKSTCARLAEAGVLIVRPPGPMKMSSTDRRTSEIIAFIEDPDGYRIELIEAKGISEK